MPKGKGQPEDFLAHSIADINKSLRQKHVLFDDGTFGIPDFLSRAYLKLALTKKYCF